MLLLYAGAASQKHCSYKDYSRLVRKPLTLRRPSTLSAYTSRCLKSAGALQNEHIAFVVAAYTIRVIHIGDVQPSLRVKDTEKHVVVLVKDLLESCWLLRDKKRKVRHLNCIDKRAAFRFGTCCSVCSTITASCQSSQPDQNDEALILAVAMPEASNQHWNAAGMGLGVPTPSSQT